MSRPQYNNEFDEYCRNNYISRLKKLLFPSHAKIQRGYIKNKINIHQGDEYGFIQACNNSHLETVEYLTTLYKTNKYKNDRININVNISDGFYYDKTLNIFANVCKNGQINIIKYLALLYKTDGYPPINIHIGSEHAFRSACANNHLTVVKYLILLYRKHKVYSPINIYANTSKRHPFSYYDFISTARPSMLKYLINLGLFDHKTFQNKSLNCRSLSINFIL